MKLPRIEEHINKKGNRVKSMVAFLGLGSGAMAAAHGLPGLAGLGIIIPMAFDAYTMHNLLNGKRGHKTSLSLYEPIFKTSMKKWINKYVNEPEDIIEKKYKVVFLNAWLKSKFLKLNDISGSSFEPFIEISGPLKRKGLIKYKLDILFNDYTRTDSKEAYGEVVDFNLFINEDKNSPEKVAVAKKVYQEYSDIGLAANQFLKNNSCDGLLMLQDYKFTATDYSLIEAFNKAVPKSDYDPFQNTIITDEVDSVLPKIVEHENDITKLKILGDYCNKMLKTERLFDFTSMDSIRTSIKTKVDYLELSAEMGAKDLLPGIEPKKEKRMKV